MKARTLNLGLPMAGIAIMLIAFVYATVNRQPQRDTITPQFARVNDEVKALHSRIDAIGYPLRAIIDRVDAKTIPQSLFDQLQSTSVRVDVGFGCGTGVLVTRQVDTITRTYVWTAGHVVSHLQNEDGTFGKPTIYQEIRKNGRLIGTARSKATVIAYSDPEVGEDLAVLEIDTDNFAPVSLSVEFADDQILPIGTDLIHVGCTLGLYNSTSLGVISQTDRDILNTGRVFDQTSCMGYPGSSGGGVYLAKGGKCIGLLVRGAGAGLNFIVPIRRMIPWAKAAGVEWAINPKVAVPLVPLKRVPTTLETEVKAKVDAKKAKGDETVKPLPPGGPASDRRIHKLI